MPKGGKTAPAHRIEPEKAPIKELGGLFGHSKLANSNTEWRYFSAQQAALDLC
jgi:hypothetical protein